MDFRQSPSVAIDGEKIRRVREEKKLTQLYVSKVVGVTTDTVSRWENNRYPSIRRDNALKLAEALEVELTDILKHDDDVEEHIFKSEEERSRKYWPLVLLAIVLLVVVVAYFHRTSQAPPVIKATRILPPYAAPGSSILIRIKLSSEKPLKGIILREEFPKGWKLLESDPPASSLDNLEGKARWIFRSPTVKTEVSYRLEVADDAKPAGDHSFSGELIANPDGQRSTIPVDSIGTMQIAPYHWADTNGNGVIDDTEILEVSEIADETGKLHLGWDLLEKLWDAGGYRWDAATHNFVPVHPQQAPPTE